MSIGVNDLHYSHPSGFLRRLMADGILGSRVEQYVNSRLRGSSDSWYAKEVAGSGVDAAERKLAEWIAPRHAFADSVSAVASGLLALATLDDNRPESEENESDRRQKPEPSHVKFVPLTDKMDLPGVYPS
jgi:hypothetical protein